MSRRRQVVLVAGLGALGGAGALALVGWNTTRDGAALPPEPSAVVNARAAPSALPLQKAVPPPPSPADAYADAHKVSPPCDALRAESRRVYEQSRERLGPESVCSINLVVDSLGCTTASSGLTWGYRLASATAALPPNAPRDVPSCTSKWRVELVREIAGESTVVSGGELDFALGPYDNATVQLQALSDYDADGAPELLRTVYRKAHEGDAESVALVLGYRAGQVAPYAPARALTIDHVEDVDGDGLIDLTSAGPYRSLSTESDIGTRVAVAPPLFVHHAERDGSFSMRTPAAIAYTQKLCPDGKMPEFAAADIDNPTPLARALICARLGGTDTAQIESRFRAVCPTSFEEHEREAKARQRQKPAGFQPDEEQEAFAIRSCREWVLDLARIAPPFTLTKPAP